MFNINFALLLRWLSVRPLTVGIGFSVLSYAGAVRIGVSVDAAEQPAAGERFAGLPRGRNVADLLVDGFEAEFRALVAAVDDASAPLPTYRPAAAQ